MGNIEHISTRNWSFIDLHLQVQYWSGWDERGGEGGGQVRWAPEIDIGLQVQCWTGWDEGQGGPEIEVFSVCNLFVTLTEWLDETPAANTVSVQHYCKFHG